MTQFIPMRLVSPTVILIVSVMLSNFGSAQDRSDQSPWQPGRRSDDRNVFKARISPTWFDDDARFWYRNDLADGKREFVLVDAETGTRTPAFDHARLAKALAEAGVKNIDHERLSLEQLQFRLADNRLSFRIDEDYWQCDLETYQVKNADKPDSPLPDRTNTQRTRPTTDGPRATRRNGPETEVTFVNRTGSEVELFWLDSGGQRRSYGKLAAGEERVQHTFAGHVWEVVGNDERTIAVFEAEEQPAKVELTPMQRSTPRFGGFRQRGGGNRSSSPDGKWNAVIKDYNLYLRNRDNGEEVALSQDGQSDNAYEVSQWSPDSKKLVAFRVQPGDQKQVHLIESSPPGGGRAALHSRNYPQPGDEFAAYELNVFDVAERKQTKPEVERIDFGRPRVRWNRDGHRFTYEKVDRGHQRFRLIEFDTQSGSARSIIDETSDTFIWTAHTENVGIPQITWLDATDEIVFVSERDGWRHLYLVDAKTGQIKNEITSGEYVVRGIEQIDEEKRQIWFRASGKNSGQDPYLIHYYRIHFDGSELVALTEGNGQHSLQYSPNRRFFIDTYSRVDMPPVHELRRASDGQIVCEFERADISELEKTGWKSAEVFVTKGRDGKTDIWGIICRPRNFDPSQKYPILEDIYAGPQGSFVPKTFSTASRYQSLNELGFIVVKIDGMGTANRSKAFHDVCWKNLKDAGLPDRIAWIKAAAEKYPYMDVTRVGVYGTSAGGQNAAGAVLFHPDFYKVAVASCGCHDNRLDKASWNEQWMGFPVGSQYAECSNIDNAWRLKGKLMLIVGEMDTNVPPESTLRFADALIKADKDFELVVIPGAGHGNGGAYGRRKMEDFFVRHLQGAVPGVPGVPYVAVQQTSAAPTGPSVIAPPDSFFEMVRDRDRDAARQFYKKYIDINGIPVVAAAEAADDALRRTHFIVTHMLAGRADVVAEMHKNGMYLIIIGRNQVYTDMPEYRNHPNPAYQNERVRGTGGKPTSFGEENLLSLPLDRYDDESIGVHEFCHTIDGALRTLDRTWSNRRDNAFRNAIAKGLWKNTYAGSNAGEFWAEICQSYFDCNRVNNWNHGPIGTREQLREYDPESYELVRTTFALSAEQDWRYSYVQKLPNVATPPPEGYPRPGGRIKVDPYYTKFTWAREFPVLGRQASDEALLAANHTIRKMFAYRHDILKAIIADGAQLVVLGRNERVADLPEYESLNKSSAIDAGTRTLEYAPETKLIAVGEEAVLGGADNSVIRLFAKALYHVTASRAVDQNWENRGRAVQQYELRVTRLDTRFGSRVDQLHKAATAAGKWQGTHAIRDPISYWSEGVAAYFNASGEKLAPTREALKQYDPDLYALVHETMAYEGHQDWRSTTKKELTEGR